MLVYAFDDHGGKIIEVRNLTARPLFLSDVTRLTI